jgi:hypothetical protein
MVDLSTLKAEDLQGLSPGAVAELATRMLAELKLKDERAERDARTIRFKDAKLEKITFELARLKAWKFGAHTERLNAEQRQMFETTAAEDEADLAAQLAALKGRSYAADQTPAAKPKTQPRRVGQVSVGDNRQDQGAVLDVGRAGVVVRDADGRRGRTGLDVGVGVVEGAPGAVEAVVEAGVGGRVGVEPRARVVERGLRARGDVAGMAATGGVVPGRRALKLTTLATMPCRPGPLMPTGPLKLTVGPARFPPVQVVAPLTSSVPAPPSVPPLQAEHLCGARELQCFPHRRGVHDELAAACQPFEMYAREERRSLLSRVSADSI